MRGLSHKLAVTLVVGFSGMSAGATVWAFPVPPIRTEAQMMSAAGGLDRGYGVDTSDIDADCRTAKLNTVDASGHVHINIVKLCD